MSVHKHKLGEHGHRSGGCGVREGEFMKPLPNFTRSPCPALNALANHGYL